MADLKVRWRGEVYELPTCLNQERAAVASAEWPDGIVDIATMFAPEHVSDFSEHQRRQLAHMVLESLGESTLGLRVSSATLGKTETKAVPAGFGTMGHAVTSRPVERSKLDHETLQALASSSSKARGPQPGSAIRKVASSSSGDGGASSSSGGEGGASSGSSSSGGDGGTL